MKHQDHYRVLGVKRDATIDEIKVNFRRLCKETHPDVAPKDADASDKVKAVNTERFKEISYAASILTNAKKREIYDLSLRNPYNRFRHRSTFTDPMENASESYRESQQWSKNQRKNATGLHAVLESFFRPRNFILVPIAFYATVATIQFVTGKDNKIYSRELLQRELQGGQVASFRSHDLDLIPAWKNPMTNRYESPAPWDPLYKELQPELEQIPRREVTPRLRSELLKDKRFR